MSEHKQTSKHHSISNEEVRELIYKSQQGDELSRNQLIENNTRLVWSVVQRFLNRGYEPDDLFQIGCIGLIKSIDKFDLSYEVRFSTYAVPMIIGEIQRFLRDDGTIKVSRSLKETNQKIRQKKDELSKEFGRTPSISELSEAMGMPKEELVMALEANQQPQSIYETVYESEGDPITLMDQISDKDNGWFDKIALKEAIRTLNDRERLIIYLRYYMDQTQSEVAKRLQISQVQVSRLEKQILEQMGHLLQK
ncbi:RNA polymerase sporulation sigma factor SigF [Halalkalibacillus sediminis]|uniref:RNA polymerase sigma factor n=2 Tax=Halalkalibacillus sediminis TaxID=2018042 RepID=A0A2I0QX63_9BACI|nr:RNA polymerase sporulation sigma factor SigF [Halalkalibacillus sediminis]PKR78905.1 RNA polymerase sporulation sigma factor SigF [Halalkalibacillus sediminis]